MYRHSRVNDMISCFTVGSIVRFAGDDWLDDLKGSLGIIMSHEGDNVNTMLNILVQAKILKLPISDFQPFELEIIQQC